MKKLILASLVIFSSLFSINTSSVHAQVGSMMGLDNDETTVVAEDEHGESVEAVLEDLLNRQNVSTVQELDLSKASDDEWERLGDAVMELQHPGQAHEAMDRMMGGEGSESLRQMHINLGQDYLGYGSGNNSYGSGMMMGYNNKRNFNAPAGMMGLGSMMGYGDNFAVHMVLTSATWIALIVFLVTGSLYFIKGSKLK